MDTGLYFGLWTLGMIVGGIVIKAKGRSLHWLWLAFSPLSALILIIVVACFPGVRECPGCESVKIRDGYDLCPRCQDAITRGTLAPYDEESTMVRGRVRMPVGGRVLRLRLLLPDSGEPKLAAPTAGASLSYRATVKNQQEAELFRMLGVLNASAQPQVEIECPARGLAPGVHYITLEASAPESGFQTVGGYSFQLLDENESEAVAASSDVEKSSAKAEAEGSSS